MKRRKIQKETVCLSFVILLTTNRGREEMKEEKRQIDAAAIHSPAGKGKDERNANLCSVMLSTAGEEHVKVMRRKPSPGDSQGCSQGQWGSLPCA